MIYILGPCAYENWDTLLQTATELNGIMRGKEWYMKASFDKANRTSIHGKRGKGLENTLIAFHQLKKLYPNMKFITDVHEVHQVEMLVSWVDAIQIPAFLCRQTDLVVECAKHFNHINVKKGQWLGPNNLIKSVDKIKETNPDCEAWICERGRAFCDDHLVVDYTIVDSLKKHYDKVILDCTHSVQRSRTVHGLQGDRGLAKKYLLSAPIFGYDGIFAEVHPDPPSAISDGDCQIYLNDMRDLMRKHEEIRGCID